MKRTCTSVAGLTLAAALFVGGCSAGSSTNPVAADASTADTSTTAGAVAEVGYADLDIDQADLAVDPADSVAVTLADGASEGGNGVSVDGDTVTITEPGTYRVTGTLSSGSLVVDAPDGVVNLVLAGVDITADGIAAINVADADQAVLWLADGSDNVLADAQGTVVDETVEDAPNATLFSTSDLWIAGDGALSVTAHAADAITSKDSLILAGGDIEVTAADDGVRVKDHLVVTDGTLGVNAQGDALRSDNESVTDDPDAVVGVIWIDGGELDLTAGADAIDAFRQVTVLSGDLTIAADDDGVHSDNVLRIDGGTVTITESFEGIEAAYLLLSGGDVEVVATDDGINVAGGVEELDAAGSETATGAGPGSGPGAGGDPGMAAVPGAADGQGGAAAPGTGADPGMAPPPGSIDDPDMAAGGPGAGGPPRGGMASGGMIPGAADSQLPADQASTDLGSLTVSAMVGSGFGGPAEGANGTRFLAVSGGTFVIDASSDGVDVNGAMTMTGGTLVVSGTDDVRNGALDVDDAFTISGGTLAANGTSRMAVAPGEGSSQATVAMTFSGTVPADTVTTITDDGGEPVASFTTLRDSQSMIYSSEAIVAGDDYTISVGGDVSGTGTGPLVVDGTVTGSAPIGTVTAA